MAQDAQKGFSGCPGTKTQRTDGDGCARALARDNEAGAAPGGDGAQGKTQAGMGHRHGARGSEGVGAGAVGMGTAGVAGTGTAGAAGTGTDGPSVRGTARTSRGQPAPSWGPTGNVMRPYVHLHGEPQTCPHSWPSSPASTVGGVRGEHPARRGDPAVFHDGWKDPEPMGPMGGTTSPAPPCRGASHGQGRVSPRTSPQVEIRREHQAPGCRATQQQEASARPSRGGRTQGHAGGLSGGQGAGGRPFPSAPLGPPPPPPPWPVTPKPSAR